MGGEDAFQLKLLAGSLVEPDPRLQQAYRYWRRARGQRSLPRRKDIDPTAIAPDVLPFVILTDVVDGGRRFRFRLVGTGAVSGIGSDLTGRYVDEVNQSPAYQNYMTNLYRRAVTGRVPVFSVSHYVRSDDPTAPNFTT